jgi:hypothetical protein
MVVVAPRAFCFIARGLQTNSTTAAKSAENEAKREYLIAGMSEQTERRLPLARPTKWQPFIGNNCF